MEQSLDLFLEISSRFSWMGNWFFFFIAIVECIPFVGTVFPGGTLIIVAGFFAAQGVFSLWGLAVFSVAGAIIGDYAGYCCGRWGGKWLERKGYIKADWMAKGEEFFNKYGNKSVLWGRFFGATRAVVPFVAGASKMRQGTFLLWNIIGALIWAGWNIFLGYFPGNIISVVIERWSGNLGIALSVLAAIALIYLTIKKHGQTYWQYFKHMSLSSMGKLESSSSFQSLSRRQPALPEIISGEKKQEKIFAGFWILLCLVIIYLLIRIIDLFR